MRVRKGVLSLVGLLLGVAGLSAAFTDGVRSASQHREPYRLGTPPAAHQHAGHAAATKAIRVAVDGAVDPDAVPDDVAYAHFLRAFTSSVAGTGYREHVLEQIGLAPADRAALVAALGSLGAELDAIDKRRAAREPHEALKRVHSQAVLAARSRIHAALSGAGMAMLDSYIRAQVKRRIVIYRG